MSTSGFCIHSNATPNTMNILMIIQFSQQEFQNQMDYQKHRNLFNLPMRLRHQKLQKVLLILKCIQQMLGFTKICLISNLTCQIHKISEFQAFLIATPVWRDTFWVLAARWVHLCHTQAPYLDNRKQTSKAMNSFCLLRLFTSNSSPLFKLLQQHYSLQCYNQGQVAFCPRLSRATLSYWKHQCQNVSHVDILKEDIY